MAVSVTLEQAKAILDLRDRSFVACDIDSYLSIWATDCTVEGPAHFIEGRENLGNAIQAAWSIQTPIHMATRTFGVNGNIMFHEFVLIWENRESRERLLQTGASVSEVDESGQWRWLREYFDGADQRRGSAAELSDVHDFMTGGRPKTPQAATF